MRLKPKLSKHGHYGPKIMAAMVIHSPTVRPDGAGVISVVGALTVCRIAIQDRKATTLYTSSVPILSRLRRSPARKSNCEPRESHSRGFDRSGLATATV
jgi:hypothetical protein